MAKISFLFFLRAIGYPKAPKLIVSMTDFANFEDPVWRGEMDSYQTWVDRYQTGDCSKAEIWGVWRELKRTVTT